MFKKIALCAMLVLILAPAAVMAAGPQVQAPGIGKEAGSCLQVQHQMTSDTTGQEKFQNSQGQGSGIASRNGDVQMLRTRSCDQTCEQDQAMVRNMTRDQIRLGSGSDPAGEHQGTGSNGGDCSALQQQDGSGDPVQNRFGLSKGNGQNIVAGFADQLGVHFRNAGGIFRTLLPQSDAPSLTNT